MRIANPNLKLTVGLITRQRSLLEQEDWRTVPWALNPSTQSAQSRLVSILAFVPGILEDDSQLDREFDFELHNDLIQRLNFKLEQLFRWRWRWEGENPNAAWEEESSREPSIGLAIQFATLPQAIEIMIYNSVLIWILGLLWKLNPINILSSVSTAATHAHTNQLITAISPLRRPGEAIQLRDIAIEICRAFDFQIRNIRGKSVSSLFFLMPIGLAWSVLEHENDWITFIHDALTSSSVTSGFQTGHNVFEFGSYAVPKIPR